MIPERPKASKVAPQESSKKQEGPRQVARGSWRSQSKRPWIATGGKTHIMKKGPTMKARLEQAIVVAACRVRVTDQLAISNKATDMIVEMKSICVSYPTRRPKRGFS